MSIYRLSISTIKRSEGRSAVACAAYRSGSRIECERTGRTHDYRKKGENGVVWSALFGWQKSRSELWNSCEAAEKRKDSQVCRDVVIALPSELSPILRSFLANSFGEWLADEYGCAVDLNIHAPAQTGDDRQHHAHLLITTREVSGSGMFGKKIDRLGFAPRAREEVERIRAAWAAAANVALIISQNAGRLDHRSYLRQGLEIQSQHKSRKAMGAGSKGGAEKEQVSPPNRLIQAKRRVRQPISSPRLRRISKNQTEHPRPALTDEEKEAIRRAIRSGGRPKPGVERTNSNPDIETPTKRRGRKY